LCLLVLVYHVLGRLLRELRSLSTPGEWRRSNISPSPLKMMSLAISCHPTDECAFDSVKHPHLISMPLAIAEEAALINTTFSKTESIVACLNCTPESNASPTSNSIHGRTIANALTQVIGRIRNAATASANSSGLPIFPRAAKMKTAARTTRQICATALQPVFPFTLTPLLWLWDTPPLSSRGDLQVVSPLS